MSNTTPYPLVTNTYLPYAVRDDWHSAIDIAHWLELNGHTVWRTHESLSSTFAITKDGWMVHINGFTVKVTFKL